MWCDVTVWHDMANDGIWHMAVVAGLHLAVKHRNFAVLSFLLELGAGLDVNQRNGDGDTALTVAAFHGEAICVRALLAGGAAVDVPGMDCCAAGCCAVCWIALG
jgi:hypothetical protein